MDRRRGKGWSMGEQRQEKNNLDDSAVLESITSQWWSFSSFVPLVTGALWLWLAASGGLPAVLLGAVPGALLLSTGLSGLLWPWNPGRSSTWRSPPPSGGSSHCQPSLSSGLWPRSCSDWVQRRAFSRQDTWPWDSTAVLPACRRPIRVLL